MLLADGLLVRSGLFYPAATGPDVSLKPLEKLSRAHVITFLLDKGPASAEACPDAAWLGAFGFQCPPEPLGMAGAA